LFLLQHLAIGRTAPEIEGEDISGNPLKLSDYRGKVVLISSWATWCGPCMTLVPQERALVERLKDKPFALLGINADADRETAKLAVDKEGITWPSWWDGGSKHGPIASQWNIKRWPTLYMLDGKGVVRYKGDYLVGQSLRTDKDGMPQMGYYQLNEAVDKLLREIADAQ
jgi:thiol-disulfide isomerase/thioredoxin